MSKKKIELEQFFIDNKADPIMRQKNYNAVYGDFWRILDIERRKLAAGFDEKVLYFGFDTDISINDNNSSLDDKTVRQFKTIANDYIILQEIKWISLH